MQAPARGTMSTPPRTPNFLGNKQHSTKTVSSSDGTRSELQDDGIAADNQSLSTFHIRTVVCAFAAMQTMLDTIAPQTRNHPTKVDGSALAAESDTVERGHTVDEVAELSVKTNLYIGYGVTPLLVAGRQEYRRGSSLLARGTRKPEDLSSAAVPHCDVGRDCSSSPSSAVHRVIARTKQFIFARGRLCHSLVKDGTSLVRLGAVHRSSLIRRRLGYGLFDITLISIILKRVEVEVELMITPECGRQTVSCSPQ